MACSVWCVWEEQPLTPRLASVRDAPGSPRVMVGNLSYIITDKDAHIATYFTEACHSKLKGKKSSTFLSLK